MREIKVGDEVWVRATIAGPSGQLEGELSPCSYWVELADGNRGRQISASVRDLSAGEDPEAVLAEVIWEAREMIRENGQVSVNLSAMAQMQSAAEALARVQREKVPQWPAVSATCVGVLDQCTTMPSSAGINAAIYTGDVPGNHCEGPM
jgi:hypothetical protein